MHSKVIQLLNPSTTLSPLFVTFILFHVRTHIMRFHHVLMLTILILEIPLGSLSFRLLIPSSSTVL